MQTVKIIPTSKRAKDRVKTHGEIMELIRVGTFNNTPAIFVKSLDKTSFGHAEWLGWFTEDEIVYEASVVKLANTRDLKSLAARLEGSSPSVRTNRK